MQPWNVAKTRWLLFTLICSGVGMPVYALARSLCLEEAVRMTATPGVGRGFRPAMRGCNPSAVFATPSAYIRLGHHLGASDKKVAPA